MGRLKDVITIMRKEIIDCHAERKSLEGELCKVTKQFQKFVDYVFHAMPGQADYLLPLELQRQISSKKDKEEKDAEVKKAVE